MENIISGITRSYTQKARIEIYTAHSLGVSTLKEWSDTIVASLCALSAERDNYLIMFDLSADGVSLPYLLLTGYNIYTLGITPAGQRRVESLLQARPGLRARVALILSSSLSGEMAVRRARLPDPLSIQIDYKLFFEKSSAMDWLNTFIPQDNA